MIKRIASSSNAENDRQSSRHKPKWFFKGSGYQKITDIYHRPLIEPLEDREMLAVDFLSFNLINDNGHSTVDLVSTDPRVTGEATNLTQGQSYSVQFDIDGDYSTDGSVLITNNSNPVFEYDLRDDLNLIGSVPLQYRLFNNSTNTPGAWSEFEFVHAVSNQGEIYLEAYGNELVNRISEIDFGTTHLDTPVQRQFSISNIGGTTIEVSRHIIAPRGFSVISPFDDGYLQPGEVHVVTLKLDAEAGGDFAGDVVVFNSDRSNDENSVFTFSVSGSILAPEFGLSVNGTALYSGQSRLDFGNVNLNNPVIKNFDISNLGVGILSVSGVTLPDGFSLVNSFSPFNLQPGQSQTLAIRFDASETGDFTGLLQFESNDRNYQPFEIRIIGEANVPRIRVETIGGVLLQSGISLHDFGTTVLGQHIVQDFRISNTGTSNLELTESVVLPQSFMFVEGISPSILAPGQSDEFSVRFVAGSIGKFQDVVEFISNDPNQPTYKIAFRGKAVSVGSYDLYNDTSQFDGISSDPRVIATLNGPTEINEDLFLQIDTDANQTPNVTIAIDPYGNLVYDPGTGNNNISFDARIQVYNSALDEYRYTGWQPVSYTYQAASTNLAPILNDLVLLNNTGNPNDGDSYDPTLTGSVYNDGSFHELVMVFDYNNDGLEDEVAPIDSSGQFVHRPIGLEVGENVINAWVREQTYFGTQLESNSLPFVLTLLPVPAPTVDSFSLASDTGTPGDGATSELKFSGTVSTITGSTLIGIEYETDGDSTADGFVLANEDGTFEFTIFGLSVGEHTVRVRGVDAQNSVTGDWSFSTQVSLESVAAPAAVGVALVNGSGPQPNVTSDPTISGSVVSEYGNSGQRLEFDHDGDGLVDGHTYSDEDGSFVYRPQGLGSGTVTLGYRTSIYDPVTDQYITSDWQQFSFEYQGGGAPEIQGFSLYDDTGDPDGITSDPTVQGSVVDQYGAIAFATLEFDYDGDETPDDTAVSNAEGFFQHYPLISPGQHEIRVRASQWDPVSSEYVTGAWESLSFELEQDEFGQDDFGAGDDISQTSSEWLAQINGGTGTAVGEIYSFINSAIGSSGNNQLDLGFGHFTFTFGFADNGIPDFGTLGFENGGVIGAPGALKPFVFAGTSLPTEVDYNNSSIVIDLTTSEFELDGTADASYLVTIDEINQTFTISVSFSYSYTWISLDEDQDLSISGAYWMEFDAYGSYQWSNQQLIVNGSFSGNEGGNKSVVFGTPDSAGAEEPPTNFSGIKSSLVAPGTPAGGGTLQIEGSDSYSYTVTNSGGTFTIDPTDAGGVFTESNVDYERHEWMLHELQISRAIPYDHGSSEGTGSADQLTVHSASYSETGNYSTTNLNGQMLALDFGREASGSYTARFTDNGSFDHAGVSGDFSITESNTYSYSQTEYGSYFADDSTVSTNVTFVMEEDGWQDITGGAVGSIVSVSECRLIFGGQMGLQDRVGNISRV